jgi:tetratricopeptide (TPR) repeat protein
MTDGDMTLPPKEKTLFNQVIRSYEQKTYKKGLKLADTILKKWPNHGETLAMKGLILGHMGGDSENNVQAHVLIKQALKNDASSHVCWHVYGLLHRNDRNYADAIKCYRSALKIDVGNCQILRDLSHMQIQLRLVDEYLVTRHELLEREPHKRANWLAVITAQHYAGAHAESLETFAKYEAEIPDPSSDTDDQKLVKFEKSEGHLFKAQVLEHAGKLDSAADLLISKASEIVDRVGWMTATARVQKKLSDFWYANVPTSNTHLEKAASLYRRLVDTMPDNHEWHLALRETLSLDEAGLVALYAELQEKHPSAEYCERAPLDFLSGDDFSKALAAYVVKPLRKGVPSLWTELGGLYSDADKTARMGAVFAKIVDSLRVNKSFPETKEVEKNPHQVFANALTLRSFHFDKVGDREGALKTIDEAIALNVKPAILELHLAKAAFLKRSGDYQGAVAQAQVARTADTADRYLNGICVKRLLQAGDYLTAERTASLFARDGDQASNLYDMQCCWFETEAGWCHLRGNRRGRALKYFQAVVKHYKDMEEDQFDFHQVRPWAFPKSRHYFKPLFEYTRRRYYIHHK